MVSNHTIVGDSVLLLLLHFVLGRQLYGGAGGQMHITTLSSQELECLLSFVCTFARPKMPKVVTKMNSNRETGIKRLKTLVKAIDRAHTFYERPYGLKPYLTILRQDGGALEKGPEPLAARRALLLLLRRRRRRRRRIGEENTCLRQRVWVES
ncbi:hypothetical protein GE21DRAFT_1943 [Neurospora crassa]|uniref:Uncharacterized protein n=1 Tax=Neurospora crassa (strain ATCC 24698 / 74-OR23-1A / CBS 708.71 / DSM 1257 / FGSC 987) TaxID=367110 RepID=V5IR16_NEUCR|nr:hypothetical protein NCU16439 [Neurospora crassa OR74A]ESA44260.1 hypothetical protein NCU16439 [Neurospora crassa OR74A]KHE83703.1 hypothetical protein GE21DRAFT_1943 [Neurospora crassa]|eukprot:XP_011393407.1 hypothetical protein NCU16439 [Neurospora crassa OR74A]